MDNFYMNTSAPHSPSFRDHFSLEQFKAFAGAWDYRGGFDTPKSPEERARGEQLTGEFELALAAFLTQLRDGGRLDSIADVQERNLAWPDLWNRFVEGEGPASADALVRPFMSVLMPDFVSRIPGQPQHDLGAAYEAMVATVDAGTLDLNFRLDKDCPYSGVRPIMKMAPGWRVSAHREVPTFGRPQPRQYAPLEALPPVEMIELRVPAPSGRIMVADWFRMEGGVFSSIVMQGMPHDSLETEAGLVNRSRHCATLGVLSSYVGATVSLVLHEGKHLVVASIDPEHPANGAAFRDVGARVSNETWWTTMVDVEIFTNLVKGHLGPEAGEAAAKAYLASSEPKFINVEPGELYMYFPSRSGRMVEFECESEEVSLQWVEKMPAVVSDHPLTWRRWAEDHVEQEVVRQRG